LAGLASRLQLEGDHKVQQRDASRHTTEVWGRRKLSLILPVRRADETKTLRDENARLSSLVGQLRQQLELERAQSEAQMASAVQDQTAALSKEIRQLRAELEKEKAAKQKILTENRLLFFPPDTPARIPAYANLVAFAEAWSEHTLLIRMLQ
jgi:hypothetical protein